MRRFSKRESEILDALYRIKEGSVGEVVAALDKPPSYDSIRTTLRILEGKGAVAHRREDRRFIYSPTLPDRKAWQSTARRLADVFFGGSIERAALAMLKVSDAALSEDEIERLERKIDRAERAARPLSLRAASGGSRQTPRRSSIDSRRASTTASRMNSIPYGSSDPDREPNSGRAG